MKIARFFAVIFAVIGIVLMLGTTAICLTNLDTPVQMQQAPQAAVACVDQLLSAINECDYDSAAEVMYGKPDLGVDRVPEDAMSALIWGAFQSSITCETKGAFYATESGIARDATITAMDIPSVTAKLNERAHALLTQRVAAATDMAELYDEENNFREELVEAVLLEAVVQALEEDAEMVTRDVTLNLVRRDGQWWVVPDQALLTALSGGVA